MCPGATSFAEALDWTAEVYRAAGLRMKKAGKLQGVADEGGFWPAFNSNEEALDELVGAIADAGFKSILCARPDQEEPGQPSFSAIADAAERAGLAAVHIPVSGGLTEGALIRAEQAFKDLPKPIFGYCRSGARAGSLYSAIKSAVR